MKRYLLALPVLFIAVMVYAQGSFDPHADPVLTPHIGTIKIELIRTVHPDELPNGQTQLIRYFVKVDDQNDNHMDIRDGDLAPFLSSAQITQLQSFMDAMWTKAEDEILP